MRRAVGIVVLSVLCVLLGGLVAGSVAAGVYGAVLVSRPVPVHHVRHARHCHSRSLDDGVCVGGRYIAS